MGKEEYLCAIDEKNKRVVIKSREFCHKNYIPHKGVAGIGYRGDEFYFKRRSEEKAFYPGLWELSVVGHVTVDDKCDYRKALIRESYEELGIKLKEEEIKEIGEFWYSDSIENMVVDLFLLNLEDKKTKLNEESSEGAFYTLEEFYDMIGKGEIEVTEYTLKALDHLSLILAAEIQKIPATKINTKAISKVK